MLLKNYNTDNSNIDLLNYIFSLDTKFKQQYNIKIRHYTLYNHTLLVLNEFDKYFGNINLNGIISQSNFKKFLAIHDIGKPIAFVKSSKEDQYIYSVKIFDELKSNLELNESEINLFYSLLEGDPLGLYFQNKLNIHESEYLFKKLSIKHNIFIKDLFYLYTVYYQVDSGSYTADAGGKYFLEKIFKYNNGEKVFNSEKGRLVFANYYEQKYNTLKSKIDNYVI